MSTVREEFGPTLPEILGPRLRALSRGAQLALAAAVLIVVVAVIALIRHSEAGQKAEVVRGPLTFNLIHGDALKRVAPQDGELLRLQTGHGERYTVRTVRLPAYRGDSSAALLSLSSTLEAQMTREDPKLQIRMEGRARINLNPGYQIAFQTRRGHTLIYGKRFLLVDPDQAHPTTALDVLLTTPRTTAVPNIDALGNDGILKSPLRSLRFGTERP